MAGLFGREAQAAAEARAAQTPEYQQAQAIADASEPKQTLWQAFLGEKLKRLRKPEPHRRQNISKLKP
jgi:hypothetical protein